MTRHRGTETEFELTTIQRLELLGWEHVAGPDLSAFRGISNFGVSASNR